MTSRCGFFYIYIYIIINRKASWMTAADGVWFLPEPHRGDCAAQQMWAPPSVCCQDEQMGVWRRSLEPYTHTQTHTLSHLTHNEPWFMKMLHKYIFTCRSSFAPASTSIWTRASSPAAEAYMRGVIPCRSTDIKIMLYKSTLIRTNEINYKTNMLIINPTIKT